MDREIKYEAKKQYFRYFKGWFIVVGVMAVIFAGLVLGRWYVNHKERQLVNIGERQNISAPAERVYDNADVLSAKEEQALRDYIAECEKECGVDLVLVTINQDVESQGYWDTVMQNTADDFYDYYGYGYNIAGGNGALLLDNWYEDQYGSQKGSWLSTCGSVESTLDSYDIDEILDEVYIRVEDDPYEAYKAYVTGVCKKMSGDIAWVPEGTTMIPWIAVLFIPLVTTVIFAVAHLHSAPAKDTTAATAYVSGGKPVMKSRRDDFIRKDVTTRRIQTGSSSAGGRSRSGGGGSHRSSSGVRHGGGGRRR